MSRHPLTGPTPLRVTSEPWARTEGAARPPFVCRTPWSVCTAALGEAFRRRTIGSMLIPPGHPCTEGVAPLIHARRPASPAGGDAVQARRRRPRRTDPGAVGTGRGQREGGKGIGRREGNPMLGVRRPFTGGFNPRKQAGGLAIGPSPATSGAPPGISATPRLPQQATAAWRPGRRPNRQRIRYGGGTSTLARAVRPDA